ncbi:MAG: hypothetical protein P1P64_03565 [Treponemataceae bacterium]
MAEKKISRDNFIATIGYDKDVAVVSKAEVLALKGKSFDDILASKNFRQAAACAVYNDDDKQKELVVKAYNEATGGHYTVKKLSKLFGIGSPCTAKVLLL